ncbi:glycoside hydrolase [Phycomyces blakesleeanus]|uniref:Mannosyl-oligosaccharide glucosidase n=1 Tax=Phycomyces blakesleeanus TaxID=4837 RepID=A0ABR3B0N2_PHYBL
MWFDATQFQGFQRIRHACDQGDKINGYGYNKHDGRNYAKQTINDGPSNIAITTEFIKIPGGQHGGDWGVRVRGKPMDDDVETITSVMFSLALEGEGSMDIVSKLSPEGLVSPVRLEGDTPELGDFEIHIVDGPSNEHPQGLDQDLSLTQWWGRELPEGIVMENLLMSARQKVSQGDQHDAFERPYAYFTLLNTLTEENEEVSNFYTFQKVFSGEFQFDVLFRSQSSPNKITGDSLETELAQREKTFDARFQEKFRLHEKGFSDEHVGFAQYLLSNMLGGIGYFHGSSVVDRSHHPLEDEENFSDVPIKAELTEPRSLFTATPSRPFFPRGFYWDEGFHELLIGKWDNDLSLDIIKNWVSLIDENGWVAREQILGEEARSKVPTEFQTQFPHYANPPTLYLAIKRYLDRLTEYRQENPINQHTFMATFDNPVLLQSLHLESPEMSKAWLRAVYPKLRLNWQWFRTTQSADLSRFNRKAESKEAYRWRGRTPNHTLTSGLDDYPRGEPPNVGELHVDLLSWMSFATRLLKDISSQLGPEFSTDVQEYSLIEKEMLQNLELLHWNEENQAFCDQTVENGEPIHVCHKGYISIFPVILGLLEPDSPKVKAIFDLIEDENELWSPYGLRSLSASDKFYNTGEDYWRGPIWININYLTLQSLYNNYMRVPGPYQGQAERIYNSLRHNIISAVFKDYQKTGYVWEQYSDKTGEGKRSHPFTGWTSLVLLIMAEEY